MNGQKLASSSIGIQSANIGIVASLAGVIVIFGRWISEGFHGISTDEAMTLAVFIVTLVTSITSWIARYRATKVIKPIKLSA